MGRCAIDRKANQRRMYDTINTVVSRSASIKINKSHRLHRLLNAFDGFWIVVVTWNNSAKRWKVQTPFSHVWHKSSALKGIWKRRERYTIHIHRQSFKHKHTQTQTHCIAQTFPSLREPLRSTEHVLRCISWFSFSFFLDVVVVYFVIYSIAEVCICSRDSCCSVASMCVFVCARQFS